MKNYMLGIDNGGTMIKASLFDEKGKEIAQSSRKTELIVPYPGHIERDMDILWKANYQAVHEVLERSQIDPKHICGVAVTGHGNGLYMVDPQGQPVGNGILSADSRAQSYVDRWRAEGSEKSILESTCQELWAGQPIALLSWMKDHTPEVLSPDNIGWIFMCKDYIRFKLTGDACAEITDYSGTNMMNVNTLAFDKEVLSAFDLLNVYDNLPPLKDSTAYCGSISREAASLTGLLEGTPVYGGLFDIDASAIGTGIIRPDQLCIVAGTWSINEFISPEPIASDNLFMCSSYCIPDTWLITEGSPTSASNLEWYVTQMFPSTDKESSVYRQCDELVAALPANQSDVLFLPFLYGSNVGAEASSAFLGLKGWHDTSHLVRAVFEGIVFSHATHVDRLRTHHQGFSSARIAGGAAKSSVWVQMFSDMLQMPIEVTSNTEIGALGAAMSAGVGAGVFSSYQEAAESMVTVDKTFIPDEETAAVYRKKYQRYHEAISSLRNFWS